MKDLNSQAHAASTATRAFARLTACEVTRSADADEGVFLTIVTDPDRPEPEFGILG